MLEAFTEIAENNDGLRYWASQPPIVRIPATTMNLAIVPQSLIDIDQTPRTIS